MSSKDAFAERRRGLEEEYFHKKEKELLEKLRLRMRTEAEREQMAEALGVQDIGILSDLQALGYTRDTVALLHMVPLIQVAWADGNVAERERDLILELAGARGLQEGSAAYQQLTDWLTSKPSEEFFEDTLRIVAKLFQALPPEQQAASKRDLVSYSADIASISGGILGLGRKVSREEREVIERIAAELEKAHQTAAQHLIENASEK
ncbi:MAG: hypothetical protein WAU45_14335 [Blastocatellia bacterium]